MSTQSRSTNNIEKKEKFVLADKAGKVKKVVFPHDLQVGLENSAFPATISGSMPLCEHPSFTHCRMSETIYGY